MSRAAALQRLARALASLSDPALDRLAAAADLSPATLRLSLDRSLEGWRRDPGVLDAAPPPSARHPLVVVTPADTPAPLLNATACALVLGRELSVRPSSRRRAFAEEWRAFLGEAFPDAVGFTIVEEMGAHAGARVIAYGSDDTMGAIARIIEAESFVAHGDRFSVACLAGMHGGQEESAIAGLVRDIVPWDGQGCLTPLLVGVSPDGMENVGRLIAERMAAAETLYPRTLPPPEVGAALHESRAACRARGGRVLASPRGTAWTVLMECAPRAEATPGWRSVRLVPVEGPAAFRKLLEPVWPHVEAVGLPGTLGQDCAEHDLFEGRIEVLGWLQSPSFARRQSGNPSLLELLAD